MRELSDDADDEEDDDENEVSVASLVADGMMSLVALCRAIVVIVLLFL